MQAGLGPEALIVDKVFIQSEFDTDIYLCSPPGCRSIFGRLVLLSNALYGLNHSGQAEQCLVLGGDVVTMMVFHVNDIQVAASEEVAESVASA